MVYCRYMWQKCVCVYIYYTSSNSLMLSLWLEGNVNILEDVVSENTLLLINILILNTGSPIPMILLIPLFLFTFFSFCTYNLKYRIITLFDCIFCLLSILSHWNRKSVKAEGFALFTGVSSAPRMVPVT